MKAGRRARAPSVVNNLKACTYEYVKELIKLKRYRNKVRRVSQCRVPLDCYSRCIKAPEVFLSIRSLRLSVRLSVCPYNMYVMSACVSLSICLLDSFFFPYLPANFLFSNVFTFLAISLSFSLFISPLFYLTVARFVSLSTDLIPSL